MLKDEADTFTVNNIRACPSTPQGKPNGWPRAFVLLTLLVVVVGCGPRATPITLAPDPPSGRLPAVEPVSADKAATAATELNLLKSDSERITGLAFSPGAARLASVAGDGIVRLWDTASGDLLQTIPLASFDRSKQQSATPMVMADQGKQLIVSDASFISRINLETGEVQATRLPISEPLRSLAISDDSQWLVAVPQLSGTCLVIPADLSAAAIVAKSLEARARVVAFLPGSDRFVVGMTGQEARIMSVGELTKDHAAPGVVLPWAQRTNKPFEATSLAVSADGKCIALGQSNSTIHTGPVPDNKEHKPALVQLEISRSHSIAFLPGDRYLATDGGNGLIQLNDCQNMTPAGNTIGAGGQVVTAMIAPGARLSATGYDDGTIKLFAMPRPIATKPDPLKQFVGMKSVMDFDAIEATASKLRAERPSMAEQNGTRLLVAFYELLDDPITTQPTAPAAGSTFSEQYLAAKPDSATARVVRARAHICNAWAARGGGFAFTVTPQGATTFNAELGKAYSLLREAAELEPNDPEIFASMLIVGKGLGQHRRLIDDYFQQGQAIDPGYYPIYTQMAEYLLPRWHGEPGELERWAGETADAIGGDDGLVVYAHIAHRISYFEMLDYLRDGAFSLEKLKAAAPLLGARFSDNRSMLNFAALCACLGNDPAQAHRLFAAIGNNREDRIWKSEEVYNALMKWSRPTLPRGQEKLSLNAAFTWQAGLAFEPDGSLLYLTHDGPLGSGFQILDLSQQKRLANVAMHDARMQHVASSADAATVGFFSMIAKSNRQPGQSTNEFHLWRVKGGQPAKKLEYTPRDDAPLDSADPVFSPDGKVCFFHDSRGQLHRANVEEGTVSASMPIDQRTDCLAALDQQRLLVATSQGDITLWDFSSKTSQPAIPALQSGQRRDLWRLAVSPDGKLLVGICRHHGLVAWSLPDYQEVKMPATIIQQQRKLAPLLAISPDSRWLATAYFSHADADAKGNPIMIWNLATMELAHAFAGHAGKISVMHFSPDSKTLATSSLDGTVKLWDVEKHAAPATKTESVDK